MMDEGEMIVKYEKVCNWLKEISNDDIIPQFEINTETVTYLYALSLQNEEMDRVTNLLIDDISEKSEEYRSETNRMEELLGSVGLPIDALSNAGRCSLNMLSELALTLDIKDTNKSSYILALDDFSCNMSKVIEEVSKRQNELEDEIAQAKSALKSLDSMSACYHKLTENSEIDVPVVGRKKQDITKMRNKSTGYEKQLREDENTMKTYGVDKKYQHMALVRMSEEVKCLEEECKPLQSKYNAYRCLPPDIHLAKVKIEEMKREKGKLESKLQSDIDYFTL